jgi:hypothetical protein
MNIWFTRSNGETPLNNPNSLDYVPGEPPEYPKTEYDYHDQCLKNGFARIGWPNTGDLDLVKSNPPRLAPLGYSYESIEPEHRKYLDQFRSIKAGDIVLIPAMGEGSGEGWVHLGIVLTKEKTKVMPYIDPRPDAYYFHFDFEEGDWYECAHRVNVLWAKKDGEPSIFRIKATDFPIWRKAFSKINDKDGTIYQLAQKSGLF